MPLYKNLSDLKDDDKDISGPKAVALSKLNKTGFSVPAGISITTEAFRSFIKETSLDKQIIREVKRKDIESMRWEEIWDTHIRIKSLFNSSPIPPDLYSDLSRIISKFFKSDYTAVRSSSPLEDSKNLSFAGLHESYIKVRGTDNIIKHIKLVWSSLYSTASLIYRKNDKKWVENSSMAVILQKLVSSKKSGLVFTLDPFEKEKGKIESVWGYNKGLVDGIIEPFSWKIDRSSFKVTEFVRPQKNMALTDPFKDSIKEKKGNMPTLDTKDIVTLFKKAMKIEELADFPQDIEWTHDGNNYFFLQARPITSINGENRNEELGKDKFLKPGIVKLFNLQKEIKDRILPLLIKDAENAEMELLSINDTRTLLEYAGKTLDKYLEWKKEYWDYLIPFAHGFRVFGDIYNEQLSPKDPHEYINILASENMLSVKRNREIDKLANLAREDKDFYKLLSEKNKIVRTDYYPKIHTLLKLFQKSSTVGTSIKPEDLLSIIKKYTDNKGTRKNIITDVKSLEENFLNSYKPSEKEKAKRLLELAKNSYRIRDDDNILMGKLESPLIKAIKKLDSLSETLNTDDKKRFQHIKEKHRKESMSSVEYSPKEKKPANIYLRQLIGQPASSGAASGKARVIHSEKDIFQMKAGEIIICDSIDPNMTFIIPAAAGVIERRGGMLIHGAIIAREYKIPCVTGIRGAADFIQTGTNIHIDGDLGIVVIEEK